MQPIVFEAADLEQFFSGKYFHPLHDETTEMAVNMRVHADGIYPELLIEDRRPHESESVREYRRKIWKPITKPEFSKVLVSLAKIRRSTEWSVRFDPEAVPARIREGETLEDYVSTGFPRFTSLTNWVFSVLLREYAVDANAWIAILPTSFDVVVSEFLQPRPIIFRSEQIVEVQEEQYLVALSNEKVTYVSGEVTHIDGDRYYIVTTTEIQRWDQSGTGRKFQLSGVFAHDIGELPAFQMRGQVIRDTVDMRVNESRLAPMLPRLDEAVREYSDLQAEVVQHIHSEKWEIGQDECNTCKGEGLTNLAGFGSGRLECSDCHGTGFRPRGPYTSLMVKPGMPGESTVPTPPMGYVQKDTNIVEVQDRRIDKHIFRALSAVNMEFLMQAPQDESGIAKAYDADETNNFVHAVAEDLVAMMDDVVYYINEMRYRVLIPDAGQRSAMLPAIAVPERFDLFSSQMVQEELLNAKEKGLNPILVAAMELNFASKKFSDDPEVQERLYLVTSLDPLPNTSEEDKMMRLQNGGISKENYVISSNIESFIARARQEQPDFAQLDLKVQSELMRTYAKEVIDGNSAASQISLGLTEQEGEGAVGGNTLKASVGGLTGMIEIAKAVASGLYDLDAAIALVSDRFGISEEEARRQLGTPQIAGQEAVEKVVQLT